MHVHVQLHQKAALVTGSTDGFGEAICLALAQAGAHVFYTHFMMNQRLEPFVKTFKKWAVRRVSS